jgi:hypothetical protein
VAGEIDGRTLTYVTKSDKKMAELFLEISITFPKSCSTFPKSGWTFWCDWPKTYALTGNSATVGLSHHKRGIDALQSIRKLRNLCKQNTTHCLILPGTLDNPVYTEVYTGRKQQKNGVIAHRKCLLRKSFSHKSDSFACLVSSIQRSAHLRKRQRKCLLRKSKSKWFLCLPVIHIRI